jgi:hypothetical protein
VYWVFVDERFDRVDTQSGGLAICIYDFGAWSVVWGHFDVEVAAIAGSREDCARKALTGFQDLQD